MHRVLHQKLHTTISQKIFRVRKIFAEYSTIWGAFYDHKEALTNTCRKNRNMRSLEPRKKTDLKLSETRIDLCSQIFVEHGRRPSPRAL